MCMVMYLNIDRIVFLSEWLLFQKDVSGPLLEFRLFIVLFVFLIEEGTGLRISAQVM